MSWLRLAVLAFLITIFMFAGVASGQGRYELPEQGPQPLQNGLPEQGPQPLQSDLANTGHPGLDGSKSIDVSNPKAKFNQKAPRAAGIKKSAKGASSKPYSFGPDSFGPPSGHYGIQQAKGPQIGVPRSPGSTSFLDGYLLRSLHDGGLAGEKAGGEDQLKDDSPLNGETSSDF